MGKVGMSRCIDLIGQRFERLLVVGKVGKNSKNEMRWECICDCGKTIVTIGSSLRRGRTKSCGCLSIDKFIERNKERKVGNNYDLSGNCGVGWDSKGLEFYFDLEDYEKVKDYTWYVTKKGYVATSFLPTGSKKGGKVTMWMHRIILGLSKEEGNPDHINHCRQDNRKANLRKSTYSQNGQNKEYYSKNTSGKIGVSWQKNITKWFSYISIEGKRIPLGYYENLEDAIKAREDAEDKYFGEFSYKNSMEKSSTIEKIDGKNNDLYRWSLQRQWQRK
jgi:hypothetical protein